MPSQIGADERAQRNDSQAAGADVVQRPADEAAPDPFALDLLRDLRVYERDQAGRGAVPQAANQRTVPQDLVPGLLRVVPDDVVGLAHASLTTTSIATSIAPRPCRDLAGNAVARSTVPKRYESTMTILFGSRARSGSRPARCGSPTNARSRQRS